MKLSPFIVTLNYYLLFLKGKVSITRNIPINDAFPQGFRPFLYVKVNAPKPQSAERLVVQFKVRSLNIWQRVLLPVLSIPFFAGASGFLDKVFLLNESESKFCGFYTWRSREDAERYINSYPGKLMALNATSGTLSKEIFSITE